MSQADAKKLLAKLQELVGEKEALVVFRDRLIERQIPQWFPPAICEQPVRIDRQPQIWETTCIADRSQSIE